MSERPLLSNSYTGAVHLPFFLFFVNPVTVFHSCDAGHCLIALLVAARRPVTLQDCCTHTYYLSTLSSPHWSLHAFVRSQYSGVYLSPAAATDNSDLGEWLPGRAGSAPLLIEKPRSKEVAVKVSNSGSSMVLRLANLPWQS